MRLSVISVAVEVGVAACSIVLAVAVTKIIYMRAESRRRAVIAQLLHEVRGPVGTAGIALRMLEHSPSIGQGFVNHCEVVSGEIERSAMLLDDLTAVITGQRPERREQVFDAAVHARRAAASWRLVAESAGRQLVVRWQAGSASVHGDPTRFGQALANLLSNAIRHGEGRIELRGRRVGSNLCVEVIDDGPGLANSLRVLAVSRSDSAHGHGLAVACDSAVALGGTVKTAPSDRGARMVISIPLAREQSSNAFPGLL